jgi:site-specific DNA-cytosine methylase
VPERPRQLTSVEICAGAGGQAYGVELAGFEHLALVESDHWCCEPYADVARGGSASAKSA